MATEIMPEVAAKQEAERVRLEAERNRKVALLAVSPANNMPPPCIDRFCLYT